MSLATAIVITILTLLLSALFSGSEIAFVQSSKVRMEIDAARGGIIDKIIHKFSRHESLFISTMLVGNNIVLVLYGITISFLINPILQRWFANEALVLIVNTVFSTGIVLIAGEFIPKTAFRINPNFMLRLFAVPLMLIYWVLYPFSLLTAGISKLMMKIFGFKNSDMVKEKLTIEELDDYIQNKIEEAVDDDDVENEVKIFRNAIDFKDTQMSECMIPRNEIVAVPLDSVSRGELLKLFSSTGLSKIVVFGKDIDDILGYIHVAELFKTDVDWKQRLNPVIFTPETMLANKMMRRMLNEKRSMAIVVDEFGGTAGLATLEDLVEEIFGEIEDEHDRQKQLVRETAPGVFDIKGRAELRILNEEYDLELPESENYNTLNGYLLETLGTLPRQGEVFIQDNLKFTIVSMSANKIDMVRVEKNNTEQ